jgi:hypothetical protein
MEYVQFEYDPEYWGGNYSKAGALALVPLSLCEKLGEEEAFRLTTGIDSVHVVHYTVDELYDTEGNRLEECC